MSIEQKLLNPDLIGSERREMVDEWWLEFSLATNNGSRIKAAEWSGTTLRTLTNKLNKFPKIKDMFPPTTGPKLRTPYEIEQKRIIDKRFPN